MKQLLLLPLIGDSDDVYALQNGAADFPIRGAGAFWDVPRWLWLYRPETQEHIKVTYWQDGQLIEKAYREISWFMRDIRFEQMLKSGDRGISNALATGKLTREHLSPWMLMDPYLLDILYAFSAWLSVYGIEKPLILTSALRHIFTNAKTEGAVKDSWHTKGAAADVIIPGVSVAQMAKFGRWLGGGGVGLYIQKNFVHLDRGGVRSWVNG